jgi:hypothetical protein
VRNRPNQLAFLLRGLVVAVLGCAPPAVHAPAASEPASSCVVGASPTTAPESLLVATPFEIERNHIVGPANDAERFAFAQSYETLINVDCDGVVRPGLAQSWTRDATMTRATLVLRDEARFWDGRPLLARDVLAAWRATADSPVASNETARRLADAATIVDDRTLIVSFADTAWRVLADPSLAVYRPEAGSAWPEGSGPYRVSASTAGTLTLTAVSAEMPRVVIRSRPGADPRDEIDAGTDLLLSADPASVRYAASRADLATVPLPWTRTYALAGRNAATNWGVPVGDSGAAFRASLARDAVRAEAREAGSRGWWTDASGCPVRGSTSPAGPERARRPARVVYRSDDHVARELAERIVALARRGAAAALPPADFDRALRAGTESAFIVGLARTPLDPCRELSLLLSSAPWLGAGAGLSEMLMPLVDVRSRAVVNPSRVHAVVDWSGTLELGRP